MDNDPKPAVENIKANLKIYPYAAGGYGTSIAEALTGAVRLGGEPKIPETKFVEASDVSFNTIPPSDYRLLRDGSTRTSRPSPPPAMTWNSPASSPPSASSRARTSPPTSG